MRSVAGRPDSVCRAGARTAGVAVMMAALCAGSLAACSDPPESDVAVTVEDLRELDNDVAALEERVAELEGAPVDPVESTSPPAPSSDAEGGALGDRLGGVDARLGEAVTVQGRVSGSVTVTEIGSAFRLEDASGNSVVVVSATPTNGLAAGGVVEVAGTAVRVDRDTFEQDFGIAAEELIEDPDRWFQENMGDVAISADEITVVQETPGR